MNKNIPVFYAIDNNYVPYLGVSLYSLIKNANKSYTYDIHIIYKDITDENKSRILKLKKDNINIYFDKMDKELNVITNKVDSKIRPEYLTLTIYYRLFFADMFPEYDKGIYIDADTVVPGDISELYNIDLKDNLFGVIKDSSSSSVPEFQEYMEKTIGIDHNDYVNSGVLLMNLKKLRDIKFSEHFLYIVNKYHFDLIAPDQDYINSMCYGNLLYLNREWDAMPSPGLEVLDSPKLIHYNLFEKPWVKDHVDYEDYFWNFAKETEFYQEICDYKASYNDEMRKTDEINGHKMIEHAIELVKSDVTLRSIFEDGIETRL